MPRGLSFSQIGVTEAMLASYADLVWQMSNNIQLRRGDPIRELDLARVAAERADLGMSDGQIARALGLTREQVMLIRVLTEVRRFRRGSYFRLHDLGRGRRYNPERYVPPEARGGYGEDALALRNALRFDPRQVQKFVAAGWWADDTLTGWLDARAAAAPARVALAGPAGEIPYAALRERAERFAAGLRALGVSRGDVVTVQLPNLPEFLVAFLGIARLGAVMSTAHMPYRAAELKTLLAHSRARAFIGLAQAKDFAPAAAVRALQAELPGLAHVVALGEPIAGTHAFAQLAACTDALPEEAAPAPADPFLLLYTSGTSASPKAVPQTYQTMLGNARLSVAEHAISAGDVLLSAAPFSHLFGLYSFHLALSAGAACRLVPVFTPPDFAQAIAAGRPSVLFMGPAHLAAMLKAGLLDSTDLSSVRLIVCSGSACPPELARAVQAKLPQGKFTQLWGMTETQAGLYSRPGDGIEVAAVSAGRPSPGTEVRIVDEELQVRGSLLFPGYFDNAEANADAFTADGWFRTGDLAVQDAAGHVRIIGRSKDIINRGGVKYNPRDVEDLLDAHPDIQQAAIVPQPDPVLGERACCVIVPRSAHPPTLETLCAYLAERGIAKTRLPEKLVVVAEMPMTPTRKIIKGKLLERISAQP